ncbi:restriction endonuclease subunit S [Clostridium disporicum]|uniref:restriction endonuclease subunit S n=1 Tax=Clostridium disporicum TaxID=84024 RepID=UPI0034A465C1
MKKLKDFAIYVSDKIDCKDIEVYISTDNMLPNKGGINKTEYLPKDGSVNLFKRGDILLSNIRPYFKKVWLADRDGGCSSDVLVIRPVGVSSEFLYAVLAQDSFFIYNMAGAKGSKMPRGDKKHIMDYHINNLKNKNHIGFLLKRLEYKIENNNKINSELESMAKTIYDYWFLQFEFPNEEGKPYKSSGGKMVWNEELRREIPEEWEVKIIGDIVIENPKSKIQVSDTKDQSGSIPFFTSGDAILKVKVPLVDGMNCFLNTGGNADVKCYEGKASYSTDTWCITAQGNLAYYFSLLIQSLKPELDKKFFQGTGLKHLQKPLLKNRLICVPTQEVVDNFARIVQKFFLTITHHEQENQKLAYLRDFLLPLLMNRQVGFKENISAKDIEVAVEEVAALVNRK